MCSSDLETLPWARRCNKLHSTICIVLLSEFVSQNVWLQQAAAAAKSRQLCPTLCPIEGSPPGSRPWDSPGKNTGVGCHFPLQCVKVKSQSEVAQSCLTFSNPMDCSLPGSSVHEIFQARVLEWGAIAFSTEDIKQPNFVIFQ